MGPALTNLGEQVQNTIETFIIVIDHFAIVDIIISKSSKQHINHHHCQHNHYHHHGDDQVQPAIDDLGERVAPVIQGVGEQVPLIISILHVVIISIIYMLQPAIYQS